MFEQRYNDHNLRNEYNDISNFGPGEGTGLSGLGALSGTND